MMYQLTPGKVVADRSAVTPMIDPTRAEDSDRKEILRVLGRAASDNSFIAQLTYQGSEALRGYRLTNEARAALLSGDIRWIELRVGKLHERLQTWLRCRLQQEIW
jgi:hypothetical protein